MECGRLKQGSGRMCSRDQLTGGGGLSAHRCTAWHAPHESVTKAPIPAASRNVSRRDTRTCELTPSNRVGSRQTAVRSQCECVVASANECLNSNARRLADIEGAPSAPRHRMQFCPGRPRIRSTLSKSFTFPKRECGHESVSSSCRANQLVGVSTIVISGTTRQNFTVSGCAHHPSNRRRA